MTYHDHYHVVLVICEQKHIWPQQTSSSPLRCNSQHVFTFFFVSVCHKMLSYSSCCCAYDLKVLHIYSHPKKIRIHFGSTCVCLFKMLITCIDIFTVSNQMQFVSNNIQLKKLLFLTDLNCVTDCYSLSNLLA